MALAAFEAVSVVSLGIQGLTPFTSPKRIPFEAKAGAVNPSTQR
jgi:hypothetical protein